MSDTKIDFGTDPEIGTGQKLVLEFEDRPQWFKNFEFWDRDRLFWSWSQNSKYETETYRIENILVPLFDLGMILKPVVLPETVSTPCLM